MAPARIEDALDAGREQIELVFGDLPVDGRHEEHRLEDRVELVGAGAVFTGELLVLGARERLRGLLRGLSLGELGDTGVEDHESVVPVPGAVRKEVVGCSPRCTRSDRSCAIRLATPRPSWAE